MTVEEFYNSIGGNYSEAVGRLMKDELIIKFLNMFLQDDNYQKLSEGIADRDYEKAFAASHTMKGMSANLSLAQLQLVSSAICEELRGGNPQADLDAMMAQVTEEYNKVKDGIQKIS